MEFLRSTIRSLLREAARKSGPESIDPNKGIDFYERVERYEIQLIRAALELTGGHQKKAAKLLNLRANTLSWKIKKFEIKSK